MPYDRVDDDRSDTDPTDELPILLETAALDPAQRHGAGTVVGDDDTGEFTVRGPAPTHFTSRGIDLDALHKDLEARAARIAALEAEIARLTERRLGFDRELADKHAAIGTLNGTVALLQATLDERAATERRLSIEINDRDAQFGRLLDDLDRQRAAAAALGAELETARRSAHTAAEELAALRSAQASAATATRPQTETQRLREELATLGGYIANRRAWWDELTARAAAHAARIVELERELEHRTTRQERAEQLAERESTRASALRAELGAEARRAELLDEEIRSIRNAGTDHTTRLATLQAAVAAAESASAGFSEQLADVADQLAAERAQRADHDAAHAAAVSTLEAKLEAALLAARSVAAPVMESTLSATADLAHESSAQMETELENKRAEVAAQRQRLREQDTRLEAASAELDGLRAELTAAQAQLAQARADHAQLERTLLDKDRALAAREERITSLQVELEQKLGALQKLATASLPTEGTDERLAERLRRADQKTDTSPPALVCLTGAAPRQYGLTKKTMVIGRSPQCDIQILTHFVSREHARLTIARSSAVIEDLGSTNGVFVNSVRIERQELRHGDLVMIGETQFRFLETMAH